MRHRSVILTGLFLCLLLFPAARPEGDCLPVPPREAAAADPFPGPSRTPLYGYRLVRAYPHDPDAFTQGLVYDGGFLYEGTGLQGRSSLRKVDLETGRVLKVQRLPGEHFGEGVALCRGRLVQLTWRSRVGFVYDRELRRTGRFSYDGEGWGITCDGSRLIMSDGTATLRWLDASTFRVVRRVTVTDRGRPVIHLNELEYVRGEIFANVWGSDRIARISPSSGRVTGWIDLSGLSGQFGPESSADVLNGIAYDGQGDRLFVTGKLWPKLFEIRLVRR